MGKSSENTRRDGKLNGNCLEMMILSWEHHRKYIGKWRCQWEKRRKFTGKIWEVGYRLWF